MVVVPDGHHDHPGAHAVVMMVTVVTMIPVIGHRDSSG
jgi:hypothetical protein